MRSMRKRARFLSKLGWIGVLCACGAWAQQPVNDPISAYEKTEIQGFVVLVNTNVLSHPEEAAAARTELEHQLGEMKRVLPSAALAELCKVRLWVEWNAKTNGGAEFHPSREWLREHGYNPEKVNNVEISNTRNFIDWSKTAQPCMVLHEFAHACHFLVLGENNAEIHGAYKQAMDRKLYDEVAYVSGTRERAYAATNEKEYFAELTEAFFGKNDFYPFVKADLEKHDPEGFRVLQKLWSLAPKK